jgi:hypothetical protein
MSAPYTYHHPTGRTHPHDTPYILTSIQIHLYTYSPLCYKKPSNISVS